jgi:hypothetical protein
MQSQRGKICHCGCIVQILSRVRQLVKNVHHRVHDAHQKNRFPLHAALSTPPSSNLVDILPSLAPPFSQRTSKGAPVLYLPGEGSGMTVAPQDQTKKIREFLCQRAW